MDKSATIDSSIDNKIKQIPGRFDKKYMRLLYEMLNAMPIVRHRAWKFLDEHNINTVLKFIKINFKIWQMDQRPNIGIKTIKALSKVQKNLIDTIMEDTEKELELPLMPINIKLDPFLAVKLKQLIDGSISKLQKRKISIKIAKEIHQIKQISEAIDIAWENSSTDEECYK